MSDLIVITTYFNPCRYATRRRNYDLFREGLRRVGVPCITVECAFGLAPFELPAALDVIQVRTQSLMWQKERLLNLAAGWLPQDCRYVAWLDCDIRFLNPTWPKELCAVLGGRKVAQVWDSCLRLPAAGGAEQGGEPDIAHSFASVMGTRPDTLNAGRYDLHGHTGYGWAMRREIFDAVGLYEAAVSGSADHFMAHAIYGDYNFCIQNALKHDAKQIAHLQEWGGRFFEMVQGSLGVVPGRIEHLWHGDAVNRRYFLRMHEITDLGFNPWTDIEHRPGQPLTWSSGASEELKSYFGRYFASRKEDGDGSFKREAA